MGNSYYIVQELVSVVLKKVFQLIQHTNMQESRRAISSVESIGGNDEMSGQLQRLPLRTPYRFCHGSPTAFDETQRSTLKRIVD